MNTSVIITGGSGALGSAVVDLLAARHYRVAAVDLNRMPEGSSARMSLVADLTDEAVMKKTVDEIVNELGPVGVLVNVAGGFVWQEFAQGEIATWDRMYRMNLLSAVISTHSALPHWSAQGGSIVNVGAAATESPGKGLAPYAASKSGVQVFTKTLALELADRGIRVNAVLPRVIDTSANRRDMPNQDPANWVSAESIAEVIAFLVSGASSTVTGALIPCTVAQGAIPDRLVGALA